jgi:hypothetical protein
VTKPKDPASCALLKVAYKLSWNLTVRRANNEVVYLGAVYESGELGGGEDSEVPNQVVEARNKMIRVGPPDLFFITNLRHSIDRLQVKVHQTQGDQDELSRMMREFRRQLYRLRVWDKKFDDECVGTPPWRTDKNKG